VLELTTLADVRELIDKHLPADEISQLNQALGRVYSTTRLHAERHRHFRFVFFA